MPLSAEDRLAIAEVIARYCHATDAGDGQGVADQFTEDGILEITGSWQARGRAQITQIGDFPNKPKHWLNSIVMDGTGSTARATVYYAAIRGGGPLLSTGYYETELTKQFNGQWKMVHHRFTGDPRRDGPARRQQRSDPMALTAEDRVEMIELVARYNQAIDARDGEAWAGTFTDDGVFQIDDRPEVRGREALVQMVRDLDPSNARHWATNFIIEGDGEGGTATMRAYFALLRENQVVATGTYVNELTKVDGAWRFARRHYISDRSSEPSS
jgi:uncharacterized protein (TIGR02246 family)